MHQPGEPSVEEILDSIKKVIARDGGDIGTRPQQRPTLADRLLDPVDAAEADEILELGDIAEDGDDDAATPEDALITEQTRASMQENFAALAALAQPGRQPQIVRSGETSLEGLVREMLRPMLAQWLDDNLPAMVEELVKAEIARIAGKRS